MPPVQFVGMGHCAMLVLVLPSAWAEVLTSPSRETVRAAWEEVLMKSLRFMAECLLKEDIISTQLPRPALVESQARPGRFLGRRIIHLQPVRLFER